MGRSVPVIASVVLHASVAVGLLASAAGHSRAGTNAPATIEMTVDLETTETEALLAPITPPPPAAEKEEPPPTHTHPYPVDPAHHARPHDPSMHHDEAVAHHNHDDDKGAPAEAAPALVADNSALPRFTLSSGSGAGGVHVATNGTGNGAGTAPSARDPAHDDVIVPASSVQVAARLVQAVVAAYPVNARADEVEGDVGVEIVVDREGRVIEARVTRGAGHGFDEAALTAVRAYRFSPAQREGHAVRVRMPWSVQFRLR